MAGLITNNHSRPTSHLRRYLLYYTFRRLHCSYYNQGPEHYYCVPAVNRALLYRRRVVFASHYRVCSMETSAVRKYVPVCIPYSSPTNWKSQWLHSSLDAGARARVTGNIAVVMGRGITKYKVMCRNAEWIRGLEEEVEYSGGGGEGATMLVHWTVANDHGFTLCAIHTRKESKIKCNPVGSMYYYRGGWWGPGV